MHPNRSAHDSPPSIQKHVYLVDKTVYLVYGRAMETDGLKSVRPGVRYSQIDGEGHHVRYVEVIHSGAITAKVKATDGLCRGMVYDVAVRLLRSAR